MFSKMSSDRFERRKASTVGPGSYDIPPALDDHGVILRSSSERFLDVPMDVREESMRMHEDSMERPRSQIPTPRTPRRPLQSKENSSTINSARGPKDESEHPVKRISMVDAGKGDLAIAKKAAANAHAQLRARDQKLEELQKEVEELAAANREWQRRASDLESDRRAREKAMHQQEEAIAGLQSSLEQTKSQVDAQRLQIQEMQIAGSQVSPEMQCKIEEVALKERQLDEAAQQFEEARRNAEQQASHLAAREAAVTEAAAEAVEAMARERSRVDAMEQRISTGSQQAAAYLRSLSDQQDYLQECMDTKLSEMKQRQRATETTVHTLRSERSRFVSRHVVQQAYLGAALLLCGAEGRGRSAAEARASCAEEELSALCHRHEGEAEALRSEAEELRAALWAAERQALALQQERDDLLTAAEEQEEEAEHWRQLAEAAEAKSRACATLVKEKEALEHTVQELREEIERRRATEEELQAKSRACATLVKEKNALESSVQELREEIELRQVSEDELQAKSRACAKLDEEKDAMERSIQELHEEIERRRAAEDELQANLEQSILRQAEMAGHANHRQKIRMTMSMKEENIALQSELKKARQEAFRLEKQMEKLQEAHAAATEFTPLL